MNQSERCIFLIQELLNEYKDGLHIEIPSDFAERKELLRALMNVRLPKAISPEFLRIQDEYLQIENKKNKVDISTIPFLKGKMCLYKGDITKLNCEAIVNAANSGMTGCYIPNHRCIDNCIHSKAGIELRLYCSRIMQAKGHEEKTGQALITPAFNLPSKYIIHTVGPIIYDSVTKKEEQLLESCYKSILKAAAENQIKSIAFCCISTGEFHFPNKKAAEIAVRTVEDFLQGNTHIEKVIFNVFKEVDERIYEQLLK